MRVCDTPLTLSSSPLPSARRLDINVPEGFRDQGVGAALLQSFLNWSRCGCPQGEAKATGEQQRIACDVAMPNPAVRQFVERHMQDIVCSGGWVPMLSMRRA